MPSVIEALEETREGYDDEVEFHRFLVDAYTGGGGFQGAVRQPAVGFWGAAAQIYSQTALLRDVPSALNTYLDRYPREDEQKFALRVRSAVYPNYISPLTDLKLSFILRKDFTVENRPDALQAWRSDVDGRGTPYDEIRSGIALRAAVLGWCPVVVDLPPAPRADDGNLIAITRAQASQLGLTPRVVPLFPANLVDYDVDEAGRFTWAKIRTDHVLKDGPFDKARKLTKYVVWYPDRFEAFEVEEGTGSEKNVTRLTAEGGERHGFGEVPVAICKHKPAPDDPVLGLPMHGQESKMGRELFNVLSELREQMRSQVFAILVLARENTEESGEVTLGTDNGLVLDPASGQSHYFLAPPSGPAETYERRIESTIKEMYRTARVEFSRPSGAAVSGISRKFEFAQTNRALSDFAGEIARFEERIDVLAGRAFGVGNEALEDESITAPKDFAVEDLQEDLQTALESISLGLGPTAEKMIKMRIVQQRLPNLPEVDMAQIESELEELQAQSENEAALEEEIQEVPPAIAQA